MSATKNTFVGQSFRRKEDKKLLTGNANYVSNMKEINMIEASFVRSSYAHAKIKQIHTEKAKALDGVIAVVIAKDIEGEVAPIPALAEFDMPESLVERINPIINECPEDIMAKDKVIYVGQLVAVVLANNRYIAEDAASLIKVEYEILPVITDPSEAVKSDSPNIHPHIDGNVQASFELEIGNLEETFKNADEIISARFEIPRVSSNPMETRGVLAKYDQQQEQLIMWSSTQVPYLVRRYLTKCLHLNESDVRVIAPDVGGGFGPKANVYPEEIILGYLAKKFKRPVKWVEDRLEHLLTTRHARDQVHEVQIAMKANGKILGIKDEFVLDSGAYNPQMLVNAYNSAAHLRGVFNIPNYAIKSQCVFTNKTPNFAYRGAGRPEAVFVMDRIIYHVAKHLKLDIVEVIRKNIIQTEEMPFDTGIYYRDGAKAVYDSGNYPEALDMALKMVDYENFRRKQLEKRSEGKYLGVGFSSYIEGTGIGPYEGALVRVDTTGQVVIHTGSSPHGQSHETVFSQICADELEVHPDQITVKAGDTSLLPFGIGTFASRSAVVVGSALKIASKKLRDKLVAVAAEILECDRSEVTLDNGKAIGILGQSVDFARLSAALKPGPFSKLPDDIELGAEAIHYFVPSTVTYSSGIHVAVVEVNKDTGFANIVDFIVVHDCGKVINPIIVEGQLQGGVAQGIGEAMYEEAVYDKSGQMITGTFMDYLIPTSMEIPTVRMNHQENLSTRNDSGFKGVGEGGAISPLGAIANGVNDALSFIDVSFDRLPVSPNAVYHAIKEAEEKSK